jgi:hypothetical protein
MMAMTHEKKMRVLALFIAFLFVGGLFFALLGGGK